MTTSNGLRSITKGLLASVVGVGVAGAGYLAVTAIAGFPTIAQAAAPAVPATPAALTGRVSSQPEPAMEGVVVNARMKGSNIMVSVSTNAQGVHSFPKDRLAPGTYDISMRAEGYVMPLTTATITASGPTALDLTLKKATQGQLELQLTNSEWMQSMPGKPSDVINLLSCLDCHGLQRPMMSSESAATMALIVERMGTHGMPASPNFPWFRPNSNAIMSQPPSAANIALANLITSADLSGGVRSYPLKTTSRPTGKSTQAIVTTYFLPDEWAPHDTLRDENGNIWISDFQHSRIGKLDPKTGEVTQYAVPVDKPGFATGGLGLSEDKDGNIWGAMMAQNQVAKVDVKTGKVSVVQSPGWDQKLDTVNMINNMVDALHSDVDGKLWFKSTGGPVDGHGGQLYQLTIATGELKEILPPKGKPDLAQYGMVSDLQNNVYSMANNLTQPQIWKTDAKTGETTYIDIPGGMGGGRRGHIDSQNRLWFSGFWTNQYEMYDPKTNKVTQWNLPIPYGGAYDIGYDDVKYTWGADMSTDLVQRLNVETGTWDLYLLPIPVNTRHIDVQKSSDPKVLSSMWTEGQQNGTVLHIEPLTP